MIDCDLDALDPGIRDTVAFLRDNGFNTTDSGDGRTKAEDDGVMPFPHVAILVTAAKLVAETDRLMQLVLSSGHSICPIGSGEEGAEIQASYDPANQSGVIMLTHFVVPWQDAS